MKKKPPKPTPIQKQKEFAKEVALTGDIKASTLKVYGGTYPSKVEEKGREVLSKDRVVKKIIQVWNEMGLTLNYATKKHLEVLKSRHAKKADILKAVDMVYKGHGAYDDEGKGGKMGDQNFLMMFIQQRRERGLPIPKEIAEAVEEKGGDENESTR